MAIIKPKQKGTVKKKEHMDYSADTFNKYKREDIVECSAQELLDRINPVEVAGRKFISFDTEACVFFNNAHDVPKQIVRRWIKSGSKSLPIDLPFSIQVYDGTTAFVVYDWIDNKYTEFKKLAPLFENPKIEKVAHNTKFDMHMWANIGMKMRGRMHDTVVQAKLVDENQKSFALMELAKSVEGGIIEFEYMVDTYKALHHIVNYKDIPRDLLTQYGGADVINCLKYFLQNYKRLEEDDLVELYNKECELMMVLYVQERYGFKIDKDYEEPLKRELTEASNSAEEAIYATAGKTFNVNSTKQLYDVLMGLGVSKDLIPITEKGNPSLKGEVLEKLAENGVPIVKNILDFRKYEKLLGTYANGIYEQRDAEYRVHGNINQTEATTGRMSVTKPALQTLPKKDTRIRSCFIPESDEYVLYMLDLDQIEYRGFAHYAQIPDLLHAINEGHDVHAATAAKLTHEEIVEYLQKLEAGDEAAKQERVKGKTINFALIYGVGINHLAELLKCTTTEASTIKSAYFAELPEAQRFIYAVQDVIKRRGYVRNFYGRRRRLTPDECFKGPNALLQGWAADYIKDKMVDMYKYIMYHKLKTHMILTVHDEEIIQVYKNEEHHVPTLRWLMSDFSTYRCKITAGVDKGDKSWGHKVGCSDIGFMEPDDKEYLQYDVYDGSVFEINRR